MIDSVVKDVRYHDEFKLVGDKKVPGGGTPKAASVNVKRTCEDTANNEIKNYESIL